MAKKQICSSAHFNRLLKSFNRIGISQIELNKHLDKYSTLIFMLINHGTITTPLEDMLKKLGKIFKQHPFKSHSCLDDVMCHTLVNKFWVSYTIENNNKKRHMKSVDYTDCYIVFKIYMQIGFFRKKRIARWAVKVDWL